MNKLLILAADAERYDALVKSAELPQLEIHSASGLETPMARISDCNIVLGEPPLICEALASLNQLDWAQSSWAGVETLCAPGMRRDYVLTGAKDVYGPVISEYVMTYLFALERGLFRLREKQLEKHWQPRSYRLSKDITLGIIGLGSIGRQLARTARYFGIRVIGLNQSGKPCENVDKVYTSASIDKFLEQPDYVVVTLPETAQTRHFINADTLALMKPSAVLINVGRGRVINESELVIALQNGVIKAAVLDVFETEPLPEDSLLWTMPNVFVTPHVAAISFPEDIVAIFIENYQRFLQQEPLLHIIDFDLGY